MSGPLAGVRVVDFSCVLAGPLCARTLLDLGAEVIKIEPPRPDVSRFAFPGKPGMSGYYAQQNAGKRNVSIDLNVPGARELALRLCGTADVVIENFRAGTWRFFGLDYATLSARNPRLIYASVTSYGQGGPWQGRMMPRFSKDQKLSMVWVWTSPRTYSPRMWRTVSCRKSLPNPK